MFERVKKKKKRELKKSLFSTVIFSLCAAEECIAQRLRA